MTKSIRAAALVVMAAGLAPTALAQQKFKATPVVSEGDSVAGIGLVTSIEGLAVNSGGQWIVWADTDNIDTEADHVLIKNSAAFLREGQPLIVPTTGTLDSFDSMTLNNNGDSGWNFFLAGTGSLSTDSGLFRNDTLILQESTLSTSLSFSPGTPYIGFFETRFNDADELLVMASVDDPLITSTVDRAVVIMDVSGPLPLETVVAKEGDILPGLPDPVADFATGGHEIALNNAGSILFVSDTTGATTADTALYRWSGGPVGTPLAAEGGASPVAGRTYAGLTGRGLDLNDSGSWVIKAPLDSSVPADNEVLVVDGAVVAREGNPIPAALGPYNYETFGTSSGPVDIDNRGRVLFFAEWSNPDTLHDTGLLRLSGGGISAVLLESDSSIDARAVKTISSGARAFAVSDNGRFALIEVALEDGTTAGLNAAVLIEFCSADLNEDGLVDFADYLEFLNRFDAGDPSVDYNGDGLVDFADYLEFLNFYDAGC
ncbi:MAG: EF-hand domain-containing protein [Phycisphaerales bacterium]|nr:EF-hand domain-containing protein [Phycisphaerales bacterium]